jgi:hypothetical protein
MRGAVVKRGKTYSFVLPLERDPEPVASARNGSAGSGRRGPARRLSPKR